MYEVLGELGALGRNFNQNQLNQDAITWAMADDHAVLCAADCLADGGCETPAST